VFRRAEDDPCYKQGKTHECSATSPSTPGETGPIQATPEHGNDACAEDN